jgi:protein SCO1/2
MRRSPALLLSVLVVLSAALGGFLWYLGDLRAAGPRVVEVQTGTVAIGGPFSLIDQNGMRRTEKDFGGKPILVFFGYTYCPDVCPTTLSLMSAALERLGPDAKRLTPVMITVDPKRDTPATLKAYLASFGPEFVGLTGSDDEIAAAAKAYKVYYRPANTETGEVLDHSSIIYLMDGKGGFLAHYTIETPPDEMARDIKAKLAKSS